MQRFKPALGTSARRNESSGSIDYWVKMEPDDKGPWVLFEDAQEEIENAIFAAAESTESEA